MEESITCEVCHGPGLTQAVVRDVCKGCHGQPLGETEPEPSAIMQSTPLEFERSVAKRDGQTCPDCHMPKQGGMSFHGSKSSRVAPESYKGVVRVENIERRSSQIVVTVKNNVTGHWLPTGAATNVIFLEVVGYDAKGQVAYQNEHRFEKSVFSFRKMPMAVTGDTRLKDNEKREVTFDVPMSVVRISATLTIKPRLLSGEAVEFVIDHRDTAIGLAG
ncbi:protein of unknown function [Denitratisoma oestradiolicum]|uniref:Cytochrome c-552/4 domain-containing protein n=2 Tax=Denitratisoma oestradiolicum TaxID=311182 RepID=A0A6S6Y4W9_9PROT|nr:protein of unknown function [Denitratisoma oestradiolicum]